MPSLTIAGIVLSSLGSIVLIFTNRSLVRIIKMSVTGISITLEELVENVKSLKYTNRLSHDMHLFDGWDKKFARIEFINGILSVLGFVLLNLGMFLQVISVFA